MAKMRILNTMRKQTAVYWAPDGLDEQGRTTYADPVEMRIRWEDVTEVYLGKANEERVSKAKVYMEDVPFAVEGLLWKGVLADLSQPQKADPLSELPGVAQIERVDSIPTLSAQQILYIAYL